MKSFDRTYLEKQKFPLSLLNTLHTIREAKEKFFCERRSFPHLFTELAREQRRKDFKIKRHSHHESERYARTFSFVSKNRKKIPFNLKTVLQLNKNIFVNYENKKGVFKSHDNRIQIRSKLGNGFVRCVPARHCKRYMFELHRKFKKKWATKRDDPLILISAYIIDFFQIHPFFDGNGRTARLLLMLLLYKSGHEICKYVNLENMIQKNRERYLCPHLLADIHWKKQKHELSPMCEYLANTVLASYRQIERKINKMKKRDEE